MKKAVLGGGLAALLFSSFPPAPAYAAGAVESLAQEVTGGLSSMPSSAVVVAAPFVGDQPVPKGDELALRVAALVAGRIGGAAKAHPQVAQLGTARALAGRGGGLVYVQVELVKGDVRATADVYPSQANAWDRVRNPLPSPTSHAFATARVDAEVRAFLPPVALEQAAVHKSKHDEGEVLAAACGDLDGDGGMEIALVSRARVAVGRLRAGSFVPERTAPWSALAPRAPVPMREPLATAVFRGARRDGAGALLVGTTDRGAVAIAPSFVGSTTLPAMPVPTGDGVGCVAVNPAAGVFEGTVSDCTGREGQGARIEPPVARFDAFAAVDVVTPDGKSRLLTAAREPSAKLRLRLGTGATRVLEGAGAQVAVGDLDQDGVAEVVTTADQGDDFVSVVSWGGGEPRPRIRIPAPAGVRALAVCPPEDHALPALVAVVGNEVWVVR